VAGTSTVSRLHTKNTNFIPSITLYERTHVRITNFNSADYFLDNYGTCRLEAGCGCLHEEWLGRKCHYWEPLGVRSLRELNAITRRKRKEIVMALCQRCHRDKPENEFHHSAWGRSKVCLECLNRPRVRNRHKIRESKRRRRIDKRLAGFNRI
jgi:hypothetical protein